jgi:hypothetical protein
MKTRPSENKICKTRKLIAGGFVRKKKADATF